MLTPQNANTTPTSMRPTSAQDRPATVRERHALSLEDAVWRLSGHPHQAFRIADRGLVREGFFADLVAFDPDRVGCAPVERVHDQPGDAERLIVRSTGIEGMWVNGVATRVDGEDIERVAPG